jgi:O-acetyl-ADP-ribose deacetylase (regulator of RNase III)
LVEQVEGNLFESGAPVLVNPVNCVGASGKGLALEFKRRFPEMEKSYRAFCRRGEMRPGRLHLWRNPPRCHSVVCFPTKRHWRDRSRIEDIEAGLAALRDLCLGEDLGWVALPRLGCGLGGLSWDVVGPLVDHYLGRLPEPVKVYRPAGA